MALERLHADPAWQVIGLLTTVNRQHDRIAIHGIRREVLEAQAAALSLPLLTAEMDWPGSNEAYLEAWMDALDNARHRWPELQHCAFGDILLPDARVWRERQMRSCGWESLFPLWGEDTAALARHFIERGHRANIACVDTTQLDAAFCGRYFNQALLAELPITADACGENGEYHTLVWGGPMFEHDLELIEGDSVLRDDRFQFQDFLLAHE